MDSSYLLIIAGAAILFCVFLSILLRKIARQSGRPRLGTFEDTGLERRAREEIEELLLQIQQISREQIAKLDTKIRILNQLVLDADQRKRELEALVCGAQAPAQPDPKPAPAAAPPQRPANPLHEKVYTLKDEGKTLTEIREETGLEAGEIELILGLRSMKKS